jgi:hypothetical protein
MCRVDLASPALGCLLGIDALEWQGGVGAVMATA